MSCWWGLGTGTTYTDTAGSWTTKSGCISADSSLNWIATNGATYHLTGVQLELGSNATPFEHRSYGDELAKCQRYFQYCSAVTVTHTSSTRAVFNWWPEVRMRAKPSGAIAGHGSYSSTTIYYEHIPHEAAGTLTSATLSVGNLSRDGSGGCILVTGTYSNSPTSGKPAQIFSSWGTPNPGLPDSRAEFLSEL